MQETPLSFNFKTLKVDKRFTSRLLTCVTRRLKQPLSGYGWLVPQIDHFTRTLIAESLSNKFVSFPKGC